MGLIRDEFGNITIEQRRTSFIIYDDNGDASMEFAIGDLPDLMAALADLKGALDA